jgi:hypothetical protein
VWKHPRNTRDVDILVDLRDGNLLDGEREIAVMSCEDLIIHKLLAGRIIDSADVAALLRANRAGLDLAYLKGWLGQRNLLPQLETIWHEKFPSEPLGG